MGATTGNHLFHLYSIASLTSSLPNADSSRLHDIGPRPTPRLEGDQLGDIARPDAAA